MISMCSARPFSPISARRSHPIVFPTPQFEPAWTGNRGQKGTESPFISVRALDCCMERPHSLVTCFYSPRAVSHVTTVAWCCSHHWCARILHSDQVGHSPSRALKSYKSTVDNFVSLGHGTGVVLLSSSYGFVGRSRPDSVFFTRSRL
jgi:hypothetical protein